MGSAVKGLGELGGRVERKSQSLASAAGQPFVLEFSREFENFAFRFRGGAPTADQVLVGFGKGDSSGLSAAASANEVIDPARVPVVRRLDPATRWVWVYLPANLAGVTIDVYGLDAEPEIDPVFGLAAALIAGLPTADAIAAAIVASTLSGDIATDVDLALRAAALEVDVVDVGLTQNVNTVVATSGASSTALAANAARRGFRLANLSGTAAELIHCNFAAVAATTDDMPLRAAASGPMSMFEMMGSKVYRGEVRVIAASGTPSLQVVEWV
jgi:hypothetical protein